MACSPLRCLYGAPQIASASADISASANVFTIARSTSGPADSACSRRNSAGFILLGAVIAFSLIMTLVGLKKDPRGDRLLPHDTPVTRQVVHHLYGHSLMVSVRWHLRYGLSYRDVEELLAEHGVEVDHVSVFRWVQRFRR